mmetsp:Transcript_45259/g.94324  ORF Transcript_45259/g.94324 Transcript_45259/m.94324 type:complete len:214 (-) Transcript_45259:635-1276(-)
MVVQLDFLKAACRVYCRLAVADVACRLSARFGVPHRWRRRDTSAQLTRRKLVCVCVLARRADQVDEKETQIRRDPGLPSHLQHLESSGVGLSRDHESCDLFHGCRFWRDLGIEKRRNLDVHVRPHPLDVGRRRRLPPLKRPDAIGVGLGCEQLVACNADVERAGAAEGAHREQQPVARVHVVEGAADGDAAKSERTLRIARFRPHHRWRRSAQ